MRYTFTWLMHRDESGDNWVERTYDSTNLSDAAILFYTDVVKTPDGWSDVRITAADTIGTEPERMLQNWERDGFNEVSDGYLSNLAASFTNEKNRLAHRPEYCADPMWMVHCPQCGADYAAKLHEGQYGYYVRCPHCWKSVGRHTKKFAKLVIGLALVCGAQKVARVNSLGCPYAGCPKCNPDGDHERKPVGALIGYTDR